MESRYNCGKIPVSVIFYFTMEKIVYFVKETGYNPLIFCE